MAEITIKPTLKQDEAYKILKDKETRYLIFGGGAGGGKSWIGCEWLIVNCYLYPKSKWFIGRESLTKLMSSTYQTFSKVCSHHKIPRSDWKLNGQYNYIEFSNGSRIDFLDLKHNPSDQMYERLGSLEYTGGFIEEGGEVHELAFDVLKSRVGRHMNKEFDLLPKILITCNPSKNWLYREFYKKRNELDSDSIFIQSLYMDNPYTAESYGEQLETIKDKATKERLMFGNWEYDDDPSALMIYDYILDIFTNTIDRNDELYLTADIARFGEDKTVIMVWKGLELIDIDIYSKSSTETCKNAIKELVRTYNIPYSHILIDEDGVGGGVIDSLGGVNGFINNSRPLEVDGEVPNYANLKSQCYFMLADYVNEHKIAIKLTELKEQQIKEILIEDLEQVKIKDMDKDGKQRVVPKDEVKEHLGRSPDYGDAFMMRMWFELAPKLKGGSKKAKQYRPKVSW